MEDVGGFNGQLSCLVTQVRSIPEIGSCNEPITDLSQFQPTRRQLVLACEFPNGWAQTHPLGRNQGSQNEHSNRTQVSQHRDKRCNRSTIRRTNAALVYRMCLSSVV